MSASPTEHGGCLAASPTVRIVAVGSELLDGDRYDTNSPWMAARCQEQGLRVTGIAVVPDEEEAIAAAMIAARAAEFVLVSGGIGPTDDDRTRAGIALGLGLGLARCSSAEAAIRARLAGIGRSPSAEQLRQADLPSQAEPLPNSVGIAPGFRVRSVAGEIFVLPGVPAELMAMFDASVAPRLRESSGQVRVRRVLKVAGRTESGVDGELRDVLAPLGRDWTILAGVPGIEVVLRAAGDSGAAAREKLVPYEQAIRARLGADVYGSDEATLASVIGGLLRARSATVACAESCTAGMVSAALTSVAGSSAWFRGGLIAYDDRLKRRLAGVPAALLAAHGAVSEAVARALALGAQKRCGTDFGVGVTGIAGPGGGTPEKPVGTVHVAVTGPGVERASWRTFFGDRDAIRARSVTLALDGLRRVLLEGP